MSTKTLDAPFVRRTSERRRLKMLRTLDEYKISNPFKSLRDLPDIPDHIAHQLLKIDFLSSSSISMLSFTEKTPLQHNHESSLSKMRDAFLSQKERMEELLGQSTEILDQNPEMVDEDSSQETLRGGHCSGEEVITTREQLSMNMMELHDNPFARHSFEGVELGLLESEDDYSLVRNMHGRENDMIIIDEDYERYFAN